MFNNVVKFSEIFCIQFKLLPSLKAGQDLCFHIVLLSQPSISGVIFAVSLAVL